MRPAEKKCIIRRLCRPAPIHKSKRLFWPAHSTRWVELSASEQFRKVTEKYIKTDKILFCVADTTHLALHVG